MPLGIIRVEGSSGSTWGVVEVAVGVPGDGLERAETLLAGRLVDAQRLARGGSCIGPSALSGTWRGLRAPGDLWPSEVGLIRDKHGSGRSHEPDSVAASSGAWKEVGVDVR